MTATSHETFKPLDQFREIEQKFEPLNPEMFELYRENPTELIEQIYLSQPDEPYSLRLRESTTKNGTVFTATLKDRDTDSCENLNRMEIETKISQETYDFFATSGRHPRIHKIRSEIEPGITIDWIEGREKPIIEVETDRESAERFLGGANFFRLRNVSGQIESQNETVAYELHPEMLVAKSPEITSQEILRPVLSGEIKPSINDPYIVAITGRSGSGKSTLAREVQDLFQRHYDSRMASGCPFRCEIPIISTDDYHKGRRAMIEHFGSAEAINWDDPIVYDTQLMANEIRESLRGGRALPLRKFDFVSQEPTAAEFPDRERLAPIILVEGLYADSPDLNSVVD